MLFSRPKDCKKPVSECKKCKGCGWGLCQASKGEQ
jgi:hypothetical protein